MGEHEDDIRKSVRIRDRAHRILFQSAPYHTIPYHRRICALSSKQTLLPLNHDINLARDTNVNISYNPINNMAEARVTEVENQIGTIKDQVGGLKDGLGSVHSDVGKLKTDVSDINGKLGS